MNEDEILLALHETDITPQEYEKICVLITQWKNDCYNQLKEKLEQDEKRYWRLVYAGRIAQSNRLILTRPKDVRKAADALVEEMFKK